MKIDYKKLVLLIIFLVLLVSNLIFFGLFIKYYMTHHIDFKISWPFLNSVFAVHVSGVGIVSAK